MGMDLLGCGWEESASCSIWHELHDVAVRYGWQPAGTVIFRPPLETLLRGGAYIPPDAVDGLVAVDGNGGYFSNNYQLVTAEDAHAFADGLATAVRAGAVDPRLADRFIERFRRSHFVIA